MAEQVKIPNLGESITEATIGSWLKKEGDAVEEDEVIAELETDKVAVEINAPVSGTLKKILAREGEEVEVGAVIAEVEAGEAKAEGKKEEKKEDRKEEEKPAPKEEKKEEKKEEEKPARATPEASPGQAKKEEKLLTPLARRLAEEKGVDVSEIEGTAEGGRIGKDDILKALEKGKAEAKKEEKEEKREERPAAAREERVPLSPLRKRIAERLKEAQNTAAMLTTFNEVDMTAVMDSRKRNRDAFEKKHGVKLGFMSFFAKACVHALKEIPAVNAEIDGDDIVYKNHYDIGIAVSTPKGLVVPVVRDADGLSFAEIETTIADLGNRAREGKLKLDELQGGTFTISNGGIFGSLLSTPILNPPQSAILGMHKIEERPVAVAGEVVIRQMMYLALSYDHRIIDGREAVTFLVRVKELLEDPSRLLLDI